jgi:hypothetical protein
VPELRPLLEALARMTATLRAADFNDRPAGAADAKANAATR